MFSNFNSVDVVGITSEGLSSGGLRNGASTIMNNVSVMNNVANATCSNVSIGESRRSALSGNERLEKLQDFFEKFTRVWGVLTASVLAGVGIDLAYHRHCKGYYFIGASVFILVAEVIWVVTLFLQLSYRPDHRIWKIWSAVTWFEDWKKSIVYGPMGIVPLIWPHKLWLSYVAGGQLIALAVFHFALTFKGWKRRKRKERLIPGEIDSFESSKFEEVTEVLDDCLPEPIPGSSHSLSDSLAEQSTVVEI